MVVKVDSTKVFPDSSVKIIGDFEMVCRMITEGEFVIGGYLIDENGNKSENEEGVYGLWWVMPEMIDGDIDEDDIINLPDAHGMFEKE